MQNAKTIDLRSQISSLVEEYKLIAATPHSSTKSLLDIIESSLVQAQDAIRQSQDNQEEVYNRSRVAHQSLIGRLLPLRLQQCGLSTLDL